MKPVIIIPAYNPDDKLIKLIKTLKKMNMKIIVVDDGSNLESKNIFNTIEDEYLCNVYHHKRNLGKGAALKNGMEFAIKNYPDSCGCVTADADGQHSPEDILKICTVLSDNQDYLILGERDFNNNIIPFKSRWGNRITSFTFLLSTGKWCPDTQTGLRGIPKKFLGTCLNVPGKKYEYEMNMLLQLVNEGNSFMNVPISTIYLDDNKSSHFHPVKDSVRIYFNIIKYSLSSLVCAILDLSIFSLSVNLISGSGTTGILIATVFARVLSGLMNFFLNRNLVFRSKDRRSIEFVKYFSLFCSQMAVSWLCVSALKNLPLPITLVKIIVDTALFFISYNIQNRYIFNTKKKECLSR